MFSPPSELEINELPHHKGLGETDGCQHTDSTKEGQSVRRLKNF